ncbi:MAG: TIGR03067 domain-containing protein [Pseudomonadota bacterium]
MMESFQAPGLSLSRQRSATEARRPCRGVALVTLALLLAPFMAASVQADAALQGAWVVIAGEHGGQPMDAMNGGTMKIEGDRFRIDTSSGNLLQGQLSLNADVTPAVMEMRHDDGLHWQAIYEVDADTFRMNYIDADGPDPLPAAFRTTDETEATVVVLKRQQP